MKSLKTYLVLITSAVCLLTAMAGANTITVYSLAADDGCISMNPAQGGASWSTQAINAGDEDHWLGGAFPLAGLVKFVLPTGINAADVTSVNLHLYTWNANDDGQSLGNKASDTTNYPNGPFCLLQHFTSDRAAGLNASDATAATEDIAIDAEVAWRDVYFDVTAAVKADIAAGYVRTSFRTQAVDYTGRILTVADKTEFAGYLTCYGYAELRNSGYEGYPVLTIEYIPEPATILLLGGVSAAIVRKRVR